GAQPIDAFKAIIDREIAAAVIDRLDMTALAERDLGALSGGEQQRLSIARALTQQAPILLLDEPTSALDIGHQQQALELVDELRHERGLTVISAMHDLTLAGLYADRLTLFHEGHVVRSGVPAEVLVPDVLAEFYGVNVSVVREPDGTVVVIPRRARA
ncbi:MAG TPA: ABC transporter ATP-binding protein, partial [Ilumatobacteraceae bacterium]|nr:ABC transporter ATP-binding protein [Ilumatobacteraceae bacterium]